MSDHVNDSLDDDKQRLLDLLLVEHGTPAAPTTRARIERTGADQAPLSSAQQRLWLLYELAPESTAYNLTSVLRAKGPLQPAILEGALQRIVQRHGILRTTFHRGSDGPYQVIHPVIAVGIVHTDLSGRGITERDVDIQRCVVEETERRFDLTRGPPIRLRVLRLDEDDHVLIISAHHMVYDGWSLGVFATELAELYRAGYGGLKAALPLLALDYADYAIWEQRQDYRSQIDYWKQHLAGVPNLELPADRSRPAAPSFRGAWQPFHLSRQLTDRIRNVGRRQNATLFMTLLAAFQALLHRYTGQDDFAVGVPVANREFREIEGLIGFFVNTLALRADVSRDPTFQELLTRTKTTVSDGFMHQAAPFDKVIEAVRPKRPSFQTPLIQVMFGLQNAPMGQLDLSGLRFDTIKADRRTAKFDVVFVLEETAGGLEGELEYSTDLFDADTISRLAQHYRVLLEALVDDPARRLSQIDMITDVERQRAIFEWNDTARPYARDSSIPDLFALQVSRTPGAEAIVWGAQRLTYAELDCRAVQLAHHLIALGAGDETFIGLHLQRSPDLIVAMLAVLKAGCAYVPLDTSYPAERLAMMVRDCAASIVLTQSAFLENLHDVGARLVALDTVEDELGALVSDNMPRPVDAEQLAYVIYTSGSTGIPKGVAVPHRAVVRLVCNSDFVQLGAEDRIAQASNASFDAATFEVWGALLNGGVIVGVERDVTLSPQRFAEFLAAERITTLFLTTALFNQIAREVPRAFATVHHVLFGGEAVDPHLVRRVLEAGRPRRLLHVYGPTENTTFSTWHMVEEVPVNAKTVPIGRAIANSQLYVLDRHMRPAPVGVPGELFLGGDGVAQGYLNRPDLTAERFVPDPFGVRPGGKLYRSGDIGRYRADGAVEFIGRFDNQIKIRGFRVELGEIEAALADHPSVQQTVVIYAAQRLAAYIVPRPSTSANGSELRQHLALRLPEYMIPAAFAALDRMPLNANGKVDRAALPEIAADIEDQGATPRTAVEEIIAGIWAKILALDAVPTSSNFFDLGGHSLLATQVVSRLREAFGVELPLRLLFESPTVTGLAKHIEAAQPTFAPPPPSMRRVATTDARALSFAQERLWFLHRLEPDNPFYNVPLALGLTGRLDITALETSITAVIRRHEVLRTTFSGIDGKPVQVIADVPAIALPVVDLSVFADDVRTGEAERLISDESRAPFDLAHDIPVRMRLLRLADEHHILLLTIHHIAADGWSLGVLVNELAPLYRACLKGSGTSEAALRELPIQYADFATWQRDWLRGDALERQVAYWKEQLRDAPPILELPTDRPRPPVQSYQGSSVHFRIDPAVADALRRLSRRSDATVFMTLLSAFATLLYRYSGQQEVVIGSPIANRNRGEIENLIGFFVNTLALRVDLQGNPRFEELIARVRETALEAYAHQDLPFEKLVDELQPERDLSLNPLFQVMFTLQNAPLERLELPGLTAELLETGHHAALFDLVLDFWEAEGTLCGVLEYNTDLFDQTSVLRIVRNLQTLLASVAADPTCHLDDLSLLTPQEQDELLALGAGPRREYPVGRSLHDLFEETAAQNAFRVAVVHNTARVTYGDLSARSNRIADRLRRLGVKPNDFVGILDERGPDVLAAMLGILKAGGAFVPFDPAYPAERLGYMLADSGVQILITRAALLGQLPASIYRAHSILLDEDDLADESALPLASVSSGTDLAYMLYTSGSTGLPKGAMVRHDGAINHIFAEFELLRFHTDTAFLQSAPSSSDISVWQFLAPVLIGGHTVIADFETVCEPTKLFQLIRSEDVTLIELVPVVLRLLLDHARCLPEQVRALPRLEWAMVTGEAATPALINHWLELYPEVRLVNAYGPTEAADDICQGVLARPLPSGRAAVPIGRPLANLTLYVLDRNLQLVPAGVPGEICVSGVGVGAGYWQDEARTRDSFVSNPFAGGGRGEALYRTGDLGRWMPDGTLECIKRIDHQIKLRGFRIELGEIEGVLSSHPMVREAAVSIRRDRESDHQLAAYVVPDLASAEVRRHVDDLKREQIGLWQDLHEDSYRDELLRGDPTFNVIGWDSNYTGLPLPEADMREYVQSTTDRILALHPRRVLEIGCGTGLIMFPLLPHCEAYVGVDLSNVAISRLRELQSSPELWARIPGLDRAELLCRKADAIDSIKRKHDTIVLPSVVQYFPGIEYLLQVLDTIFANALAPGGSVFIGDVRNLILLEAFHASVQLSKASPSDSTGEIGSRVRRRLAQEQELAINPAFFLALKSRFPAVTQIEILPKRGTHHNEMTRFRYDVVIRTSGECVAARELPWTEWRKRRPSVDELRALLSDERPPVLALHGISNLRVQEAMTAAELLLRGYSHTTVGTFNARGNELMHPGIEPEDLWRLGEECSYDVDISYAGGYRDGSYDAVFRSKEAGQPAGLSWDREDAVKPWDAYANNPLQEKLARRISPLLREFLKQKLPLYMVPSSISLLPNLPVSPAGKLDRDSLPAPDISERVSDGAYVAPRTHQEQALAEIWAEILGLPRIGIQHNFFELGGHSLKATQVVSRIHRDLGVQVPLRELFSHPTIADLAPKLGPVHTETFSEIPRAPDAEHFPLSHAQRRLWILSQLEGASSAYNMPMALRLEGWLDVDAFRQAYARVIERHESLRTVFLAIDGTPRQRVMPRGDATLGVVDLTGKSDTEQTALELALADAAAPFDLQQSPVRASLLRLGPARFVLLLNMHHIVSDDWSLNVFVSEFVQIYAGLSSGSSQVLPPLRLQYRDYASWQHDYLASQAVLAHRDYWHAKLAGDLPVLDMPTDLPRPPIKTYRGQTLGFNLDAERAARLAALAREHDASVFMALVAVVKTLLHRYTGQDDILVGFPIGGRTHPDLENQIGFYVNTLPLRGRVRGEDSFLELLETVKATATGAYEHQAYPFDRLVDELNVPRDVSRSPMFDVVVIMQNAPRFLEVLNGITVDPLVRRYENAKFDLALTFEERRDGTLQVDITYNSDLFLPARIRRMGGHFRELVAGVLDDPSTPLARLPILEAAEREQVLSLGVPAPTTLPSLDNLSRLFERQAQLRQDDVALIMPAETDGAPADARQRQSMSYAALNARANRLAHHLRGRGVGPDVLVALCLPRSLDLVVGILGIVKAGGAYLPLDTTHPPDRRVAILQDSGAKILVTHDALRGEFEGSDLHIVSLDGDAASLARAAADNPVPIAGTDHLAYVIYTSGSTGRPKGVAVTHRNVARLFIASGPLFAFGESDVWTLFHSCAFDFSVWEMWGALLYGGRLVVVPHTVTRSPQAFYDLLVQERVTVLNQTPSAFRQLIRVEDEAVARQTLALRYVIFGGEALDFSSLAPWLERHGDAMPRLINMYGITETTVHVTFRPVSAADLETPGSRIGKPLPDMKLYILDRNREPVPIGAVGELYVGGGGVARGYLDRPDLTAERFVRNPFDPDPDARLYRSGDLARFLTADHDIEYLGRIDHQVQLRGFRVEVGEIEAKLRNFPAIRDAVVLVDGDGARMRLLGYFTGDSPPTVGALRRYLQGRLPDYMVPSALVALPAFPLTANGKLDRVALLKMSGDAVREAVYSPPEGEMEQLLASLFQDVLGIDRVGVHDNFFELGANSLLLVQIHRKLCERLDRAIPVVRLFQFPTIAALARELLESPFAPPLADTQNANERAALRRAARGKRNMRHFEPIAGATSDGS